MFDQLIWLRQNAWHDLITIMSSIVGRCSGSLAEVVVVPIAAAEEAVEGQAVGSCHNGEEEAAVRRMAKEEDRTLPDSVVVAGLAVHMRVEGAEEGEEGRSHLAAAVEVDRMAGHLHHSGLRGTAKRRISIFPGTQNRGIGVRRTLVNGIHSFLHILTYS